ncbi:hypothetical protein V3C99_017970 [Haemonchus contortus]|uniref:Tubulin_C domain-containing protein n=1 Tax=Haemonchus contortus TaxID=6289 RepID=A0A7I4Z6H0_HAECO
MLAVHRRGQFEHINNIHAACQGYPDAVRVPPTLCNFDLDDVDRDNLYPDVARTNVPCVMRFCVPALSGMAQRALVNAVRHFIRHILGAYFTITDLSQYSTRIGLDSRSLRRLQQLLE